MKRKGRSSGVQPSSAIPTAAIETVLDSETRMHGRNSAQEAVPGGWRLWLLEEEGRVVVV